MRRFAGHNRLLDKFCAGIRTHFGYCLNPYVESSIYDVMIRHFFPIKMHIYLYNKKMLVGDHLLFRDFGSYVFYLYVGW
jgi:hypothetical protein